MNGSLVLLRLLATYQPQVLKEYHFFLVLDCCAMARRMSLVGGVLEQMDRLRVPRSVYIYSALIKGYGRQKWAKQLEEVVEELLSQRVRGPEARRGEGGGLCGAGWLKRCALLLVVVWLWIRWYVRTWC